MATVELFIDMEEIKEEIRLLGRLWRGGAGLPQHVLDLASELAEEKPEGFLEIECHNGVIYTTPGPKLNVLTALLRAHRA